MFLRVIAVAAVCLAAAGWGTSTAGAAHGRTDFAFLCYSRYQVDPGVWSLDGSTSKHHITAGGLLALGYWSPFAEKSVATQTRIAGGYYLDCNLSQQLAPVAGMIVTQKGVAKPTNEWFGSHPGYYPEAA
jgi:hypothetical protein